VQGRNKDKASGQLIGIIMLKWKRRKEAKRQRDDVMGVVEQHRSYPGADCNMRSTCTGSELRLSFEANDTLPD